MTNGYPLLKSLGSDQKCLELFELMILSREADKREAILVRQGRGHLHISSSGHEGLMGVTFLMSPNDFLFPYYRGCHLMMGKGLSREVIARDFFAKATSTSCGRSVAVHAHSRDLNIFPGTAPTTTQCLPAVGTAWGQKMEGTRHITVCSLGDGATREGEFYEAVCFAVEHQLPILFLVEDNGYAISTKTEKMLPFSLNVFHADLFKKVNGYDVPEVLFETRQAIERLRQGKGPQILWCKVDRLDGHTANDDPALYRPSEELEQMVDPIAFFSSQLIAEGILNEHQYEPIKKEAFETIRRIYKEAERDPDPDLETLHHDLYSRIVPSPPLSLKSTGKETTTMVESINRVLSLGLETHSKMILFGQDIEDPKGGVFGFTKGLSTKFPKRVINAPIAEATIIGTAVGLSAMGFKPVFEIQFIDFLTPGFDQLVTQVSSLRWRSHGRWSCPLVLYAPYGAYVPAGGLWHSQSNDGWWAHIPGLRVAVPSTPMDVVGLFWSAFQDDDPSLILIPKHLFRVPAKVAEFNPIPFGKASIKRVGTDVTLVTWGNGIELAENAARELEVEEISVEVIDLRTLVPCDWETIEASLSKTGRLVVIHEDNRTCGFGATVITEMVSCEKRFEYLAAPPRLIAREDIHIPFQVELEEKALPSLDNVVTGLRETVQY